MKIIAGKKLFLTFVTENGERITDHGKRRWWRTIYGIPQFEPFIVGNEP